MRLLSARVLIPLAVVVVTWGGVHLIGSHDNVAVAPAVWPTAEPVTSPSAGAGLPAAVASPAAAPASAGTIPVLPAALGQLNRSTRDTAVGLYTVIQQLEDALRIRLDQLVKQLEPGR